MGTRASRDLGLMRIGQATRWMAVGALVGGGILSAAVAKALPGHSSHPSRTAQTPAAAGSASQSNSAAAGSATQSNPPAPADQGGSQLAPPEQAPQPAIAPPVVNSGGS